jgi:hypothetical protein
MRPGKWGNPFVIGRDGDRAEVLAKHKKWIVRQAGHMAALGELTGRDLVCCCAPLGCHCHTLLRLANPWTGIEGPLRLLVCGGRDYQDHHAVCKALDTVGARYGISVLISGAQTGADSLGLDWAHFRDVPVMAFPVTPTEWKKIGREAGPLRNRKMLEQGRPDAVVAFPGDRGTKNMKDQARAAGLKIWEPIRHAA